MSGPPTLDQLWQMAAMQHRALKGFALAHAALWNIAARRTAWQGLAVLAAMLRRLIHLMAKEIPVAPLRLRDAPLPPLAPPAPRRPRLAFRLTEAARETPRRLPNPGHEAETPAFNHARLLDRLAVLAAVYQARARLARRLARRVQTRRAPLRAPALPPRLRLRVLPGFLDILDHLGTRLAAPDTS